MPSAFAAELMGRSGFDWACIDTQHGLVGYDQMALMLQALDLTGTPAFVRVRWNEPGEIMKALDAGAQGVIVPMINSPEEARLAISAARYPPEGSRSWGPIRAALGVEGYSPEAANRRTLVAIMIETAEGLANTEDILSVPGIDAVYVGPNDLAVSHGMPPSATAENPEHAELIQSILAACRRHAVVAGIHCGNLETAQRWLEAGFGMINVGSDAVFMREQASAVVSGIKGRRTPSPRTSSYA
jgi:4-hydroxy-2-oxoheptanedioate aldolase